LQYHHAAILQLPTAASETAKQLNTQPILTRADAPAVSASSSTSSSAVGCCLQRMGLLLPTDHQHLTTCLKVLNTLAAWQFLID
jgi:hypothetical protein